MCFLRKRTNAQTQSEFAVIRLGGHEVQHLVHAEACDHFRMLITSIFVALA
jgi:hypothetical protein